ncbi:hypothetical protein OGAPHI_007112 [Ogataea philodendri]|uniref:1-phosphatidylinositol-3-phosphate 5-kinase n=1 Tax=Ogataea philodendri TaxID=1378263 RepID=A0A9P8SZL1_9ASCO|nr:uncharacterized protein OGAPHI_007112 [Ogataea philodendri]KAH3660526.1 hypothetical protein OGAPHI_007112 [Ogataea philodendri]
MAPSHLLFIYLYMSFQIGLSGSAHSTTQLSNQTPTPHTRTNGSNANDSYNDLTLNLMSTLGNKRKQEHQGLGRDYWLDDSSATKCRSCDRTFTTFRRKHHCRICGKIFCSNCTTFIEGDKFNHPGKMRVCLLCLKLADRYEEYASSEDESVIDDTNSSSHVSETVSPVRAESESQGAPSVVSTAETALNLGSAPTPPPMMAIPTTRKGEAIEIDIPRSNSVSRRSRANTVVGNRPFHPNNFSSSLTGMNSELPTGRLLPSQDPEKKNPTPLNFTSAAANAAADAASSIFNFGTAILPGNHQSFSYSHHRTHSRNMEPESKEDDEYGPLTGSHTLLSSASDLTDDEDEPGLLAFTSVNSNPMNNHEFNWTYRSPNTSGFKLEDSTSMNGRKIFRSNRTRRPTNFYRLKHRRMSRSGTRVTSDASSSTIFGRPASSGFGFGFEEFEFMDDFLRAGENHARQLLVQLLTDREVQNIDRWTKVLIKCLKKVSSLSAELANGETFDISAYLKIKKIPGSEIENSAVLDGIVFSKNLPLNTMATEILNPRIMLVTFQIEYEQEADTKFSSIEPLIAQQDQYLEKLVARIAALKPNIVLAQSTVNGYALKLLAQAGISVAYNVKSQLMQKISRLTKADIINSIDKLAINPNLGRCGKFEVKSYVNESIRRTYFYFTGCNTEAGSTVVLRGSDKEELSKVKECATLMAYVFFNVKLESGLMRDQCLQAAEYSFQPKHEPLQNLPLNNYQEVTEAFRKRILSSSPWVRFLLPYVVERLTVFHQRLQKNVELHQKYLELAPKAQSDDKLLDELKLLLQEWNVKFEIQDLPHQMDDMTKLVAQHKDFVDQENKHQIFLSEKQWEQFWFPRRYMFFDPNYHQNIATLYSMVSTKNATPCIGPEIQVTDFYWDNDFCLGQFIEHLCLNAGELCTEGCGLTLKEHFRSYVHGRGKVDVVVENNSKSLQGRENMIMAWSFCKICQNSTAVLPLSDNAWKYSFGKYLELSFWCRGMKVKGATCVHDFYRDQIHYFSFQNLAVRMEYSEVEMLDLVSPQFQLFWKPEYDLKIKIQTFEQVINRTNMFFDSVRSRLNRLKLDSLSEDRIEAAQQRINELKKRVDEEQLAMIKMADDVYQSTLISDHLKLTSVIREVQEISSEWNFEFQEFDKEFLPSEKEIKKITAFQLDKLFKANNDKNEDLASLEMKEKEEKEEKEDEEEEKVEELKKEDTTPSQSPKSRRRGNLVLERIQELQLMNGPGEGSSTDSKTDLQNDKRWVWEDRNGELQSQLLEDGGHGLPKLSGLSNEGKVRKLAEFFDAQEFFRQREQEKRKLQENSYRPKLVASRPTVEVYKNVKDAVEAEQNVRKMEQRREQIEEEVEEEEQEQEQETDGEKKEEGGEDMRRVPSKQLVPEKSSLLKSLTHFWADRSATLWEPLSYPLGPTEHIFVDSDVIVREDEPSSIIAFCLNTTDYGSKLYHQEKQQQQDDKDESATEDGDSRSVRSDQGNKPSAESSGVFESSSFSMSAPDLEKIMLKKGFHLKYQFEEGYSTISCKIFFAEQFDGFRRQCGVSSKFVESLSRCVKWDSTGGKSGSAFLKTLDDRFIIKELSRAELEAFVQFAASYFEYFAQAMFHNLPTVLVKIFGFYQIQVKNTMPGARSYTMNVLIMENLFYNRKMSRIFDLKGSMRNRHVEQTGKENEVLLDENMVEYIYESPLFVRENAKRLLRASLWNDTLFLAKMNVMDYSLVVGIDSDNKELVVGIIDCIRTFTWDKKLESWVKEKGLVGGTGVGKEPTVITPKQYKNRFREAMERYILMSPGPFYMST